MTSRGGKVQDRWIIQVMCRFWIERHTVDSLLVELIGDFAEVFTTATFSGGLYLLHLPLEVLSIYVLGIPVAATHVLLNHFQHLAS